ncbi:TY4B-J, partial [Symbiodinium sp. CCMP2456]
MRSYYESFGAALGEDSNGESSPAEDQGWGRAGRHSPENAGTGGISSDSRDREESESWSRGARTPMRQPAWDGWSEDGSWQGQRSSWMEEDLQSNENWSRKYGRDPDQQSTENWSWTDGPGDEEGGRSMENWSWKTGYPGSGAGWNGRAKAWQSAAAGRESAAYYVREYENDEPYYQDQPEEDKIRDRKGEVKVVGEDTILEKEKKIGGRVSSTYPPTFRAKPQESYAEWRRAVEFWIGGEGSQLPPELIGPRMMVQLRDRAAQLVKRLSNADVNGPDGKEVIFRELEKSPLIKQVDKHKVDEHRRRLMQLNRAPHESVESYITRASLYRGQLLGLDSSLAMGEAFYVGHLLDHAHLSRRDRAMIKTKAGTDTDEHLVTSAMVELACELEGEPGYPLGMSEPNIARNGEEWMLQRGDQRSRFQGQGPGRGVSGAPGSRAARQSFAADWEEVVESPFPEEGEDSLDEGDAPPELLMKENEAFGMQYKAKQKIAEVKKLRQYYRKPDNDAKRKALAEQMKVNPCHNCGELGHWSRECPLPPKGGGPNAGPKAQQAFVARARVMPAVQEEPADREWDLLLSMCRGEPQRSPDLSSGSRSQYKGPRHHAVHHVVHHVGMSMNEVEGYDVLWSVKELAFKIILDIGCMRSVAGVQWANMLVSRWKEEGRWLRVEPERETFKFGGGEVLVSRFRVSFVGSFAGRPVLYGFSIVEGDCPPLFSRTKRVAPSLTFEAHMSASAAPRCKLCQSTEHKTRDCPTIEEVDSNDEKNAQEMDHDGDDRLRRAAPPRPESKMTVKGRRATTATSSPAPSSEGYILVEEATQGLTSEEIHMLNKRRAKQAASKARAVQKKALTGVHAEYPSLSHAWSNEVALNLVASTASRMRTYLWKKLVWQARVKAAVEAEGNRRWKRNPRWLSMLLGKEVAFLFGHFGAMRPNRGLHQRIKAGVRQAKEALAVVERIVRDPGKKLLLEIFAGQAGLTARARHTEGWMAAAPVDLATGWDLTVNANQKKLLEMIDQCQPDLVTLEPPCGPWCSGPELLAETKLWDRRREHLPFWRLVAEVWRRQVAGRRMVVLVQPVMSQALSLNFMKDRDEVIRGVLPMCSFGLCDPETKKPYMKKVVVESNCAPLIRYMLRGAYCTHAAGEHQPIQGFCRGEGGWVRRSDEAARWPDKFCGSILQAAEYAMKQVGEAGPWAVHAATCGSQWETLAVSSSTVADEGLRQELAKHSMTGERYDFVCFDGAANQQPRRLRALVAHLHVTLGHLSNERLGRMLRLSGASEAAVALANSLRCQVCAMTRPPQNTPQVAYQKPKFFNERVSGDTFYVWDADGNKFAATHYLDALTDYQVADLTDRPDSAFSREVFQDLWLAVFGPPDTLVTDGGPEFQGSVSVMLELMGIVQEVVPEGAKWRLGQAERHGAVLKLMVMKMVKGMDLKGLKDMRHALLAAVAAKNRTLNRGGISPMQAVTGRNTMIPGSLLQQLTSGQVKFKYNEAVGHSEAIARAERIRIGALEAFHWLDSHDALRRALASKSRPPQLEGVREGAIVYVYDPPASRRGLARRMQDNSSWSGPGVIVCVERDRPVPQRVWVRIRGRVKAFPLEKLRLATVDEMASAQFITQAVTGVEEELRGGQLRVEPDDGGAQSAVPKGDGGSSSSSSSSTDAEMPEDANDPEDQALREHRAKLLDDLPHQVARNLEDRRKREAEAAMDPHTLDFQKKQKLFESLVKQLSPPTPLEEAGLRKHLEDTYAKFKGVRKAFKTKVKGAPGRSRGDGGHESKAERSRVRTVMEVSVEDLAPGLFRPGEMEALVNDTLGQWSLWGEDAPYAEHEILVQVSQKAASAEMEGVTEVTTGKARVEYRWSSLDTKWKNAYVEPLKKAVGVYLDHDGIKGVAKDQLVDPSRILSSRFVLTNKGGPSLSEAELRARWIFGGHKDPDAGLYATASPTASTLGHNLLNFVAVQKGWVVHYEDVSSAFLQGKALPRTEKVYVRVPHGYPPEVLDYLTERLGGNVRPDLVELTKAGFGLPESPRLWYLEYKDTIEELGLKELALVPGLFRAFHVCGALRAMASIHVDDTRYAGDESSQELWDQLHAKLKFGKLRKATEGWQKFCGRWERQCPQTLEMEYSMTEYTKAIPLAKLRDERAELKPTTSSSTTTTSGGVSKVDGVASAAEGRPATSASTTTTSEGVSEADGVASALGPLSSDAEVVSLLSDAVNKVVGPSEALTDGERKVISSVVGRLNWAARQGRYDLAFVSSSIQQLAGRGDPAALKVLNQGVKRAREDIIIPIRNLGCDLDEVMIISVSDAAYGAMPGGHSQSGVLVLMASPKVLTGTAPVCALEGSSGKIQRIVRCSMSAEVSSLATCFEHGDFVRAVFCELVDHKFQLRRWKLSVSRWPHYLVTDAKTGYDALNNDTLPTDRKVAIDVAVLRQAIVEDDTRCFVRW